MKKVLIGIILLISYQSCVFIRLDDSIDLGSQYRYIQDFPQVIIHHKTLEYNGGGVEIVPPLVKSYSFNEHYIIVKSLEMDKMTGNEEGRSIKYWIIDKQLKGAVVMPLDSANFYNELKIKQINLYLK